jgi:hypothetical protein
MDELSTYRDQFSRNLAEAERMAGALTDEQFRWRPLPGAWSVSENLQHLVTTGILYLPAIDEAVRQARSNGWTAAGPFRYGIFERLFVRMLEPPVRVKTAAPKKFQPESAEPKEQVIHSYRKLHEEWNTRLTNVRGVDLRRTQVVSPVSSRMKLSLGVIFPLNAAHERRHLWQARKVMEHPDFPRPRAAGAGTSGA